MPPSVASFPVCRRRVSASFNADPSAGDGHASQTMSLLAQPLLGRVSETSRVPDGHHPEMTPRLHRPRTATSPPPRALPLTGLGLAVPLEDFPQRGAVLVLKRPCSRGAVLPPKSPCQQLRGHLGPGLQCRLSGPASETPAVTQRSASRQALPLTPGRFKCENRSLLSPLLRGDKLRGARAAV